MATTTSDSSPMHFGVPRRSNFTVIVLRWNAFRFQLQAMLRPGQMFCTVCFEFARYFLFNALESWNQQRTKTIGFVLQLSEIFQSLSHHKVEDVLQIGFSWKWSGCVCVLCLLWGFILAVTSQFNLMKCSETTEYKNDKGS